MKVRNLVVLYFVCYERLFSDGISLHKAKLKLESRIFFVCLSQLAIQKPDLLKKSS